MRKNYHRIHKSVPSRLLRGNVLCGNKRFVRLSAKDSEVTCEACLALMKVAKVK